MCNFGITVNRSQTSPDVQKLAPPSDPDYLSPIEYAYDPLRSISPLASQPSRSSFSGATQTNHFLALNSVQLDPNAAGLPYRSSLNHVYVSKHWESNRAEALTLLEFLAKDGSKSDIVVDHGITLANLARKILRPGLEHQMALATQYMFPGADERRIRLISAVMILYFVFDDKVEETPDETLAVFRDDFLRRLEGHPGRNPTQSRLQNHIDEIVDSIGSEDANGGDGGKEMLQALREAFRYVHPDVKGFSGLKDYLHFRRFNVGAAFVIAAAKFSIKSSVSVNDVRLTRFLTLVSDHLGVVNDLASYEKELRALENGETRDMINIVDVVKKVTSLKGTNEAKSVVWALQLQIERQMTEELEKLRKQGLGNDEWWFVEAVISAAVGNIMFCMTTSRHGGEASRIGSAG